MKNTPNRSQINSGERRSGLKTRLRNRTQTYGTAEDAEGAEGKQKDIQGVLCVLCALCGKQGVYLLVFLDQRMRGISFYQRANRGQKLAVRRFMQLRSKNQEYVIVTNLIEIEKCIILTANIVNNKAGFLLVKHIKTLTPGIPTAIQSSDIENKIPELKDFFIKVAVGPIHLQLNWYIMILILHVLVIVMELL